jgi:septal ring factor EnvC (AmiA/AmiB activator)
MKISSKYFSFSSVFFLIILLVYASSLIAQDKKSLLTNDKKKIEEEIQFNTRLLDETKKSKNASLNQLILLKDQINNRENLINTLNAQLNQVNNQIDLNNELLRELQMDLNKLKQDYADMIYYAYKNRNAYHRLMFIFAAENFNQAYKRLKYYQQYASFRKTQASLIEDTKFQITSTQEVLLGHKKEKLELLNSVKNETQQLNQEKNKKNIAIQELTKKEKELLKTIKEKEKAAKKLQKEIEKIIAEEIRLAADKKGTTKSSGFSLTPEELLLSENFAANKGKLPWPLERGIISSTFGEHAHPVLKNVKTKNNGIDILTDNSAKARAVFNGEVTRVISIPNYNYVVMIRHGEYLTVYSNLVEVFVKKGDKVETKQEVGVIHTDNTESKTELHFELWKGKTLLNPASWIAVKK